MHPRFYLHRDTHREKQNLIDGGSGDKHKARQDEGNGTSKCDLEISKRLGCLVYDEKKGSRRTQQHQNFTDLPCFFFAFADDLYLCPNDRAITRFYRSFSDIDIGANASLWPFYGPSAKYIHAERINIFNLMLHMNCRKLAIVVNYFCGLRFKRVFFN